MRLSKLLNIIFKKSHHKTTAVGTLAKEILDSTYSMATILKPTMNYDTDKDNEKYWVYVLFEFQLLVIHLVSRKSCIQLEPEKQSKLLNDLAQMIIQPTIESLFGHWSEDLKKGIESDYYESLARSEYEYGCCKETTTETDYFNDQIWFCFGKNVAHYMGCVLNPGIILDVQRILMEGLVNINFNELCDQACAVYED